MDLQCLESLVGREATVRGTISSEMAAEFRQLMGGSGTAGVPLGSSCFGLIWCAPHSIQDNAPVLTSTIPDFPGYQRLWARSEVAYILPIREADTVTQTATILSARAAGGETGDAFNLTIGIAYAAGAQTLAHEVRKLAYRNLRLNWQSAGSDTVMEGREEWKTERVELAGDDLRKYSELTGTQNPLHMDAEHCRRLGLPGLVIHAPFQASLLLNLREKQYPLLTLRHFNFRPTKPLYHTSSFDLMCREHNGTIELQVVDSEGRQTMAATSNGH